MGIRRRTARPMLGALVLGAVLAGPTARTFDARAQTQDSKPGAAPATPATDATPAAAATGADGNTYASPTFGYALTWDEAVWVVEDELLQDGYDGLQLGTDRSTACLEGYVGFDGDAADCLADALVEVGTREGVSDLTPVTDRDRPVPVADAGEAALSVYTQEFPDGDRVEVAEYVECRTLVAGEAVLEITFQVAKRFYDAERPLAAELLASLRLPAEGGATATPDG